MSTEVDPNEVLEAALAPKKKRKAKPKRDRSGDRELESNMHDLGAPEAWAWLQETAGPAKWAAGVVGFYTLWRVLR